MRKFLAQKKAEFERQNQCSHSINDKGVCEYCGMNGDRIYQDNMPGKYE